MAECNCSELSQRLNHFNQLRLMRAQSALPEKGKQLFALLPLLLHYNHPVLPGYLGEHCPYGIDKFAPDHPQRELIRQQGIRVRDLQIATDPAILGLFCMGSTASIGQSADSDLDIWVIHRNQLTDTQLRLLERKCQLISEHAQLSHLEINFFFVPPDKFQKHHKTQDLSKENCGSSQNWLLLDEFYRSATWLAGRQLSWYMVPVDKEKHSDSYLDGLINSCHLERDDWIDLGGIDSLPAEEYFGAALWQLYKGIDSPFKAVLKILLLESYAQHYPNTQLICHRAKQAWMDGSSDPMVFDSYYLSLQAITEYLQAIGDTQRLEIARRCFYLKSRLHLSRAQGQHDWRSLVMHRLVREWGWSQKKLAMLDSRNHWKVEEVKPIYEELIETLMTSFRKLIEFARRNSISEAINPEDIGILSRKLYAAFETLPSKVNRINPKIAPSLHEPCLSIIEVPAGRKISPGWYLYKQPLETEQIIGAAPQHQAASLIQLMSWAYFNGLVNANTQLYIYQQTTDVSLETLGQLVRDMTASTSLNLPKPQKSELAKPSEVRQLAFFVNLEQNYWEVTEHTEHDEELGDDVFNYGEQQLNLVRSVDIVYQTSWNEIHAFHFDGKEALLEALVSITSKMHKQSMLPVSFDVFCYGSALNQPIKQQIKTLVLECMQRRVDRTGSGASYHMVQLAGEKFGLFFERRNVYYKKLENPVDFYSHISRNKVGGNGALSLSESREPTPTIVENHASEGLIQFFFEYTSGAMNIYVVGEENQVETYENFSGDRDELVQSVIRFYSSAQERFTYNSKYINFNLPQFYEIIELNGIRQIVPYQSKNRRPLETALNQQSSLG